MDRSPTSVQEGNDIAAALEQRGANQIARIRAGESVRFDLKRTRPRRVAALVEIFGGGAFIALCLAAWLGGHGSVAYALPNAFKGFLFFGALGGAVGVVSLVALEISGDGIRLVAFPGAFVPWSEVEVEGSKLVFKKVGGFRRGFLYGDVTIDNAWHDPLGCLAVVRVFAHASSPPTAN